MAKCSYCGVSSGQYDIYVVRQAVKPKRQRKRWITAGYCCEECHVKKHKQIELEYGESLPKDFKYHILMEQK